MFDFLQSSRKKAAERFLVKVINQLALRQATEKHRQENRVSTTLGVRVTPLGRNKKPDNSGSFITATRDVSLEGLSFVDEIRFHHGTRLVVTMAYAEERHHLLCEVRHCTAIGRELYLTGCQILEMFPDCPELSEG